MAGQVLNENTVQESDEQLQLGWKIVLTAHQQKVYQQSQEIHGLQLALDEQKALMTSQQKKHSTLELEILHSRQRAHQLFEENKDLKTQKASLAKAVGRLQGLKQSLLKNIQDEVDDETAAELNIQSATPLTAAQFGGDGSSWQDPAPPRLAINTTSVADPVPAFMSAPDPVAQPADGKPQPVEGKQFFRIVRTRLSQGYFSEFLACIKKLNSQEISREECIEKARGIFGADNQDLQYQFEDILKHHGM